MNRLSVGQPAESIFISALLDPKSGPPAPCSTANKGAEFAAELERMPVLPGISLPPSTLPNPAPASAPQVAQTTQALPPLNVTDFILPCVFSQ